MIPILVTMYFIAVRLFALILLAALVIFYITSAYIYYRRQKARKLW